MTAPRTIDYANSTILITGGASGIGLALATRMKQRGATVVVCGRRRSQLDVAEGLGLPTIEADVGDEAGRVALAERVVREHPKLNVLINNAGIQQRPPKLTEPQDWSAHAAELAINLAAPLHLSMLLIPQLLASTNPFIVNVTSGLAFGPMASMPTYCATKAALHSFTLSLRHQLKASIGVVEIVPPAVNTDLGGRGLHDFGVPVDQWADHTMSQLDAGSTEFGYDSSERRRVSSRAETDAVFEAMNARS